MASAESPVSAPESGLDLLSLLIALSIIVFVLLALTGLHFLLKKLHGGAHPATPPAVNQKVLVSRSAQPYNKSSVILGSESSLKECSVCLSGLEEGEMVCILPNCRHAFHCHCIDAWLASHSTCPFCRSEVAAPGVVTAEENEGCEGSERGGQQWRCDGFVCLRILS